jgi:glycosyltransferase involved in cell wall biosynthesis
MARPRTGFEIIAVDNASTDNSIEIIENFADLLPIQVLSVPTRGKNHALNAAIPLIHGDLTAFTDDDILVDTNWLRSLELCADKHKDADIFGGVIAPQWEAAPPSWLPRAVSLGVTYGVTDPGLGDGPVSPDLVWGGNMMIRSRIFFEGHHRFDPRIGPNAHQYVMGSETEFTNRLHRLGHQSWFCTEARVSHIIRAHQIEQEWIIKRGFRYGRSRFLKDYDGNPYSNTSPTNGLPFPRWMLRQFIRDSAMGYLARLCGNQERAVQLLWNAHFLKGYMYQAKQASHPTV